MIVPRVGSHPARVVPRVLGGGPGDGQPPVVGVGVVGHPVGEVYLPPQDVQRLWEIGERTVRNYDREPLVNDREPLENVGEPLENDSEALENDRELLVNDRKQLENDREPLEITIENR